MEKIISLYQRNYDGDRLVRNEVVPGAEWVIAGEGVATRKWDGTACMVRDGVLYKRYDAKPGRKPPEGWEPCEPEPNEHTGHWPGWVRVREHPEDKWYRAAYALVNNSLTDGTYELCGPHFQGNPEGFKSDTFVRHGEAKVDGLPRDYESVKARLAREPIEGVVWHHPDGRMVKIKARDFGLKRQPPREQA